jgi:hypothetical protein
MPFKFLDFGNGEIGEHVPLHRSHLYRFRVIHSASPSLY